ncbi:MAG: hypothetical protein LUQ01_02815, partial [Methanolinea sp.]|nr:hypothetical protein [Methanolinea sp.]
MSMQNFFFLLITIVCLLCVAGCTQTPTSLPSTPVAVSATITQSTVDTHNVTSAESPPQENPVDAHLIKGLEYLRAENFAQAIGELNTSLSGDPNNLDARMARAQAYYALGYNLVYEARGIPELNMAIQDYSVVIERDPGNESAYTQRGWAYFFRAWPESWYHLYYMKYSVPSMDASIQDFSRALELDPDSVQARTGLAIARFERAIGDGKYYFDISSMREQGKKDIDYVFRYQTPDATSHWVRGSYYRYDGFLTLAVDEYTKAIELEPDKA